MEVMRLKKQIASLALAGTMFGATVLGVAAASPQTANNGAGGVIAAAVAALQNVNVTDNTVDVAVVQLNNSLNNLTALNNVLNNSPILSNNNILQGITIGDISVLNGAQIDVLRAANIVLSDVVGVAVLRGGDLLVFTR